MELQISQKSAKIKHDKLYQAKLRAKSNSVLQQVQLQHSLVLQKFVIFERASLLKPGRAIIRLANRSRSGRRVCRGGSIRKCRI